MPAERIDVRPSVLVLEPIAPPKLSPGRKGLSPVETCDETSPKTNKIAKDARLAANDVGGRLVRKGE